MIQASQLDTRRDNPSVHVDGVPVAAVTGENLIEMPAGAHVIEVAYAAPATAARYEVDIAEGKLAHLWYSPSLAASARGTLGPRPQPDYAMRYLTLASLLVAVLVLVYRTW